MLPTTPSVPAFLHACVAEIIKYGLIRDAPLFEWLEANMGRLLARDPEVRPGLLIPAACCLHGAIRHHAAQLLCCLR